MANQHLHNVSKFCWTASVRADLAIGFNLRDDELAFDLVVPKHSVPEDSDGPEAVASRTVDGSVPLFGLDLDHLPHAFRLGTQLHLLLQDNVVNLCFGERGGFHAISNFSKPEHVVEGEGLLAVGEAVEIGRAHV